LEEAARRAYIAPERLRRALGMQNKQLTEGEHMTEQNEALGTQGVPYNSVAAEQLVAARLAELGADGKPATRLRALGELVREGRVATSDPAGRPSTEAGMSPGTARAIKLAEQGGSREPQHRTDLGLDGVPYASAAAEDLISYRMRKLAERRQPADRREAINRLAQEGNLRTLEEVSGDNKYLAASHPLAGPVVHVETAAERRRREVLAEAKRIAEERGVPLSVVMNEFVNRGKVKL